MSPASSGALEVERYVGACLISQNRPPGFPIAGHARGHYLTDIYHGNYLNVDGRFHVPRCNPIEGWAGGMPLISFATHQKRHRRPDHEGTATHSKYDNQQSPLARLAIHTQGAPLILTKPYGKKNKSQKNSSPKPNETSAHHKNVSSEKFQDAQVNMSVADTASIASDESSGSTNSENCLPRIIKPRKRRKKDRKSLLRRFPSQEGFSTDSASPDVVEPSMNLVSYVPFKFDAKPHESVVDGVPQENIPVDADRLCILGEIPEMPKLRYSFEEIEDEKDVPSNQSISVCQCRYCDLSGFIWDIDAGCNSPLSSTSSYGDSFQFPETTIDSLLHSSSSPIDYVIEDMASLSLNNECDVKKLNSDQGLQGIPRSSSDLEVSTEIVTSLNGHRDLEIKFFSLRNISNLRIPSKLTHSRASYNSNDLHSADTSGPYM